MFLSFIIPTYNAERFLIDTLNSITREIREVNSYEIEIVIINDGSTDSTSIIAKNYIQGNSDLNIHLFSKENGGLSDARNYGVGKAQGEYIWFFDSDDLIEPRELGNICKKLKAENLDFLSIGIRDCYENGDKIDSNMLEKPKMVVTSVEYISKYEIEHSACCYIVRKNIIINNNIFFLNGVLSEDYDFTWRLIYYCKKINHLGAIAYNYIIKNGSLSRRRDDDYYRLHHRSMIVIMEHTNNFLNTLDNMEYRQAVLPYYSNLKIIALIVLLKSTLSKSEKKEYLSKMQQCGVMDMTRPHTLSWKKIVVIGLVNTKLYRLALEVLK